MKTAVVIAALLAACAARGEDLSPPASILRFTLAESPASITQLMGETCHQSNLSKATIIEFRGGSDDLDEDPVWMFYFQNPGAHLVVVTHNYEKNVNVSALFPAPDSQKHFFPNKEKPSMTLLVRKLDKDRVLLANVQGPDSMLASQIILTTPERAVILFPFIAAPKRSEGAQAGN
jgi:hypothetical protein